MGGTGVGVGVTVGCGMGVVVGLEEGVALDCAVGMTSPQAENSQPRQISRRAQVV